MGTGTEEFTDYGASQYNSTQDTISQSDIMRMYESGLSIREIAARIGKGRHYVHDRIKKDPLQNA